MNIQRKLSVLCAAAVLLSLSACKQQENGGAAASASEATVTQPAAETSALEGPVASAAHEAEPQQTYDTFVLDGESFVVMTTSSRELQETTLPPADAPVMTSYTGAPFSHDDIKLEIISGADRITTDVDHISLKMSNVSEDPNAFVITGENYSLEKLDNGSWRPIEFAEDMFWIDAAYEISAYSSPTIEISLEDDLYAEPITAGKYRIVKPINNHFEGTSDVYYCEFEIVDSDTAPQYKVEEENGSYTFRIDEIRSDMFVCEMPFPLPQRYYVICDTAKYPDLCVGDVIDVDFTVMYKMSMYYHRVMPVSITLSSYESPGTMVAAKPVIYLYPEKPEQVSVSIDFNGRLTITDPVYGDGWTVVAKPDGTILHGGREYPYLFWEGRMNFDVDTSRGFCVRGADTEVFLTEKLAYLGLNEKEAAEFMEFWLPFMEKNEYNVITFAGSDYCDNAKLDISPSPDTVIRVFMAYSPRSEYVDIPVQELEKAPERTGFTAVEWGGTVR